MYKTINYIKEVFGLDLYVEPIPKEQTDKLPLYIALEYELFTARLLNTNVLLAQKKTKEPLSIIRYKIQFRTLTRVFKCPVILVLPDMEAYKRNRLIQQRINFVIDGKQIFLPELLLDIREYNLKVDKNDILTPAAQCILLYHLQKESLNNCTYQQIAEKVKYPYLSVTRATDILQKLGLCTVNTSKIKIIIFEDDKKALWQKALAYFRTPVLRTVYYERISNEDVCFISDINALAYYTNINPEKEVQLAVSLDELKNIVLSEEREYPRDYDCKYSVQIWRYNPAILAENGVVDPLSLYLSLNWNKNERVEMALEQLIELQKW
jgi:DNA-binding MarR family transcriptional regulator